jgi:secondary thiamine-phosphate synthase enzyme
MDYKALLALLPSVELKVFFKELSLDTHESRELIDITGSVEEAARESGVDNGICLVWSTHTTASVIVNENEQGLVHDMVSKIAEDFPRRGTWLHNLIDDNAHSHLAAAYLGPSVAIPVRGGALVLGDFQSVFFVELDGPRSKRKVVLEVMGE